VALVSLSTTDVPTRQAIDSTFSELSQITGFTIKRPVPLEILDRTEVSRFLKSRISEVIKPQEIRAEELTLKKFGFVPQNFDLEQTTLALLTEQTAAFYDYHRRKLFLTDWTSAALRQAALVHELAHALADQNFRLERFARKAENDSEKSAARQAVVEGQASWLMRAILARHPEARVLPEPEEPFPIFDQAPLYLRETLTFPYNQGTDFQQAVFARLGKLGFAYVFEHPPVSTQQILHPDLYFAGLTPVVLKLPALKKMHKLVEGPLGELEHAILIRQFATEEEARDLSPHWRGGMYQLWEDRKSRRISLVYRSAWDTVENADRFFHVYREVLSKKWKAFSVTKETPEVLEGSGDDGYFRVDREGKTILSREGLAFLPG